MPKAPRSLEDVQPHQEDLGRLIEVESGLAGRLEQARAEGRELVVRARETAKAAELRARDEETAAEKAVAERVHSDLQVRLQQAEEEAGRRAQRFEQVNDVAVDNLAAFVVSRLLEPSGSEGRSL